ncbi:MAG: heavy metal-binding domain-containing protein [Halobacteriota archaeon]
MHGISTNIDGVTIVSSNWIPGLKVIKTVGFVYGITVRSRGLGRNITAGLRSLAGGEIQEYVQMMEQSRDEALNRMAQHAKQLGANAVISTAFDSNEISQYMQEILAYGTAVLVDVTDNHAMEGIPEEKLGIL